MRTVNHVGLVALISLLMPFPLLTSTAVFAEKLLVRSDGATYLGDIDPQDGTKFRMCDGKQVAIDKADLKPTDQKCSFRSGGGGRCGFDATRPQKLHAHRDREEERRELREWCAKKGNSLSWCCKQLLESEP